MLKKITKYIRLSIPRTGYNDAEIGYRNIGGTKVAYLTKPERRSDIEVMWKNKLEENRPENRLIGPLKLSASFVFSKPSGANEGQAFTTYPSLLDIADAMIAGMEYAGWFKSRNQIADMELSKHYGEEPGVLIIIKEMSAWEPRL